MGSSGKAGVVSGRKTADQNIPGAALVNLADLVLPVAAGQTLYFEGEIIYDSTIGNDFQLAFTVPAGASMWWQGIGPSTANGNTPANATVTVQMVATSGQNTNFGGVRAAGAARQPVGIQVRGIIVNGATAGNLQARGAKVLNTDATTPADDVVVYASSHLTALR